MLSTMVLLNCVICADRQDETDVGDCAYKLAKYNICYIVKLVMNSICSWYRVYFFKLGIHLSDYSDGFFII